MSAPIEKTEAIALNIAPYSQSSHIVTWITPGFGRLATLVKGASRPRSWFLGQYDLFYSCELLFYHKDQGGLHPAKECSPLKRRDQLRRDWRACIMASCVSGLVRQTSSEGSRQTSLFNLLDITLDILANKGACAQCMTWFELHLLDALGLAPRTNACAQCGRRIVPVKNRPIHFSHAKGGSICANCGSSNKNTETLAPPVFAMMRSWQKASSPASAYNTTSPPASLEKLSNLVGRFEEYHLGFKPRGRTAALEAAGILKAEWQSLIDPGRK